MTADVAWLTLLRDILDNGKSSKPRGMRIMELLCHTTKMEMSFPIVSCLKRKLGYKFMAAEASWILAGKNDVASMKKYSPHIASFSNDGIYFDGAYGPRIVDQLRYVCDTLQRDPDSRQAVVEIWRPNPRDSKDVPCTLTIQWLIRDGVVNCIDTMRSSDAWMGWPYDSFTFSCLTAYIMLLLRSRDPAFGTLKLGELYLTAGSSHLYVDAKADGSTMDYTIEDACEVSCQVATQYFKEYRPLDPWEFNSGAAFLDHLETGKDGGLI